MGSGRPGHSRTRSAPLNRRHPHAHRLVVSALFSVLLLLIPHPAEAGQAGDTKPEPQIPDAPQPQSPPQTKTPAARPCEIKKTNDAKNPVSNAGNSASNPSPPDQNAKAQKEPCPPFEPLIDWYARFINGPKVKRLSPKQKAWLATRNVIDPFEGITILGNSAIYVGANSHSPYGPGMTGFGRNVGVSYTQDVTGEFFGTFLIPSIVHQDPHYHRLPDSSVKRRIAHAIYQVVWTQGDDGRNMPNYANLVGFAIDDEISNLYVPGEHTNLPATASRYTIGLATAPVDNFITEFLPDFARRIHIHVVLVQRIINQVATEDGGE